MVFRQNLQKYLPHHQTPQSPLLLVRGRRAATASSFGVFSSCTGLLQLVFPSRTEGLILVVGIVAILGLADKVFSISGNVSILVPFPYAMVATTDMATFASATTASTSTTTALTQRYNLDGVCGIHLLD